jgi:TolB protein
VSLLLLTAAATAGLVGPAGGAFPGRPGKLVYDDSPSTCFDGRIYVSNPDLSGRRVLARGGNAQFSPDGRRVVYETCDGLNTQVELIKTDGSGHRLLVEAVGPTARSAGDPSFLADGRRVVFARYPRPGAGNADLWTVDVRSGRLRQLTDTRGSEQYPATSPNGRIIVFARSGNLFTMRTDGSRVRRLTNGGRPAFSPGGHLIAFTRLSGGKLFVIRPDGSGLRELDRVDLRRGKISGPAFSPAGDRIVYTRERGARSSSADLFSIRPNGAGKRRIGSTAIDEFRVDWQPR